ncbi:adenylate/guanylate cyclase domain-containing protein [Reyranella sp.]|uniref:adenylate/guanylate cyclase domain-containing protein n=1 Tax=Reyranella sp. TaxID=1929291 RepID=UPI003C7AF630
MTVAGNEQPIATATEIGSLRRRYLLRAVSAAGVDVAFTGIFVAFSDAWAYAPRSIAVGLFLLLGVNALVNRRLFVPIEEYLAGRRPFEEVERRITQLPVLTAARVALLALAMLGFRVTAPNLWPDETMRALPSQTLADTAALLVMLPLFYFTYVYFVISDYLGHLCGFIFKRTGRNLSLFFGRYRLKLGIALLVISLAPMTAVVVDLVSYDGVKLQFEIATDVAIALMGVAVSIYFIGRSLLRPIRILSIAMSKVAGGDMSVRIPVTSNDEVGELTGQFNAMVEGLREREQIRETFGRYVDESVASTILQRGGNGVLAGETREATILFTDVSGFTTIAEKIPPDQLFGALNEYLETVLAPIRAHGGVVNTFIGDGLFASFNMPLACPGHASAAIRAAIDIQRAVASRCFGEAKVPFVTRIGISTGAVIGGSIGAGQRLSFTLLGDTVNLAARLEKLNKDHGTSILLAETTRAGCGTEFVFKPLGSTAVRGRSGSVAIFTVDTV